MTLNKKLPSSSEITARNGSQGCNVKHQFSATKIDCLSVDLKMVLFPILIVSSVIANPVFDICIDNVVTKRRNDLQPPKTTYNHLFKPPTTIYNHLEKFNNHLQPPQKHLQPPANNPIPS